MLLTVSDPASECLRRAEECRRRAKTAMDAASIEHFLKMEQRWLLLAASHKFVDRVERFIRAQPRKTKQDLNSLIGR
jgi:hypothetical protein